MSATRTRKATKPARVAKPAGRAKPAKRATPAKSKAAAKVAKQAPELTAKDLLKIMELVKGANSIELKLSVPATGHAATVKGIGLDPVEAQPRQAFFFDTPDLALNKAGVVVRARRIQGGKADTVVKLRPVDPANIDAELRRSAAFKVEVDVMPGGFVCSASCKGVCTGREVLDVTTGAATLRSLFSKEQRAFFDAHAPAGITMDKLAVMGPTFVLKAKHQPKDFDRGITVEVWLYPDGSRILEISTKAVPGEGLQVGAAFRTYLAGRGISLGAPQETKTKSALEYFSARLREEATT